MIFLSRSLASNLFLAIILIAGISITPLLISAKANAEALTNTHSFSFPIQLTWPASESLCSEDIKLSGTLHVVTIFTINSNGGSVVKVQSNPQGIKGIGLVPETLQPTGTKYQGTGVTNEIITFKAGDPKTQTQVINFNLIGHGSIPESDSIHHVNAQTTVNANGVVTSFHINEISTCR
jgi:hypothetical protein